MPDCKASEIIDDLKAHFSIYCESQIFKIFLVKWDLESEIYQDLRRMAQRFCLKGEELIRNAKEAEQKRWEELRAEQEEIEQNVRNRLYGGEEFNYNNLSPHILSDFRKQIGPSGMDFSQNSEGVLPVEAIDPSLITERDLNIKECLAFLAFLASSGDIVNYLERGQNSLSLNPPYVPNLQPEAIDSSSIDVTTPGMKVSQEFADDMDLDQDINTNSEPRLPATPDLDSDTFANAPPCYP